MKIGVQKCSKCGNRASLHVGDRVTFGGNKTYFSHAHLVLKARLLGVIVNDIGKHTKFYVYNAGPKSKTDLAKPNRAGIKVISPDLFERYLEKLCRGNIKRIKNPALKSVLTLGSPIYGIGLTKSEVIKINKVAKYYQCKIYKVRKESISAVFCNHSHLNSGDADIFRAWGIPVYDVSRVKVPS